MLHEVTTNRSSTKICPKCEESEKNSQRSTFKNHGLTAQDILKNFMQGDLQSEKANFAALMKGWLTSMRLRDSKKLHIYMVADKTNETMMML